MKLYKLSFFLFIFMGVFISENILAVEASTTTTTASKPTLSYDQIKLAAESGDADAQYALGYMYYYGKGGAPKDFNLAKSWINKSAQQKQPQAVKALTLMSARQEQPATVAVQQEEDKSVTKTDNQWVSDKEPIESKAAPAEKVAVVEAKNPAKNVEATPVQPSMSEGQYTLQLLGAYNKNQISKLVKTHHLTAKAKLYRTTFNNKPWYVLIYGQYKTKSEAKVAADQLERELGTKPWIKSSAKTKHFHLSSIS